MRLSELTVEDLKKFKYPNLMAEVKETTYSICTIADHMGLPRPYRKEDDEETWSKLMGVTDIFASEALGLSNLFQVSIEYLFSHELRTFNGDTAAYWRWLDVKERDRRELERSKEISKIDKALRENPYLLKVMKILITLNDEQIDEFVSMVEKQKIA